MKNKSFLLLIGALLIFLGVGYLLEKLNIIDSFSHSLVVYWPVIAIIIGIGIIVFLFYQNNKIK